MCDINKLAAKIMNMSEEEQHTAIFEILDEKVGFEPAEGKKGRQFEGCYHLADNIVITKMRAKLPKVEEKQLFPIIMDGDIFDEHIAGNKSNIRIEWRVDKKPRVVVEGHERDENGVAPRPWLVHLVTGRVAYSDLCVDHIRHNPLINLRKELRLCSIKDNNRNSAKGESVFKEFTSEADEFDYSLARDCSHTLYAYVQMLLGIISEDELAEVNKIVNAIRHIPKPKKDKEGRVKDDEDSLAEYETKKKRYFGLCKQHGINVEDFAA